MEDSQGSFAQQTMGDRIVEARKAKNMTQDDVAKRLGISRAAVGQWEINSTSPSVQKVEEVAGVLDVAAEWLAYGVIPGQPKIVYRSPERDNIQWVPEISFGNTLEEERVVEKWGVPADFLVRELRSSVKDTVIHVVNSHAVEPEFEYGDRVYVDRADTRPSPAGVFLFWDGLGPALAKMAAVAGLQPKVRVTQKGSEMVEYLLSEVVIIGRVKGRIQRA